MSATRRGVRRLKSRPGPRGGGLYASNAFSVGTVAVDAVLSHCAGFNSEVSVLFAVKGICRRLLGYRDSPRVISGQGRMGFTVCQSVRSNCISPSVPGVGNSAARFPAPNSRLHSHTGSMRAAASGHRHPALSRDPAPRPQHRPQHQQRPPAPPQRNPPAIRSPHLRPCLSVGSRVTTRSTALCLHTRHSAIQRPDL